MSPEAADRRGLTAVLVAGGISAFGTQMTLLALPWLVLESTGSATRTGVVFAVQVLPMAVLGLFGGEVMQRIGPRRTMVVADAARAPLVALVPVLHAAGVLSFGALLAIVALHGVLGIPYAASQRVLAVDLIGEDTGGLARVNSVLEGAYNAAAFGGPAVAGALIAVLGAAQVLWIDAMSFTVSCALLVTFVPAIGRHAAPTTAAPRGVWAGVRRLLDDAFLGRAVVSSVTYGFLLRILAIALPLLAYEHFHRNAALGGLLVASSGAGALTGSFLAIAVSKRIPAVRLVTISGLLLALPLWLLAMPLPPGVLVVAVALSSAAVPISNAPYFAILTARIPAEFRPKVLQAVITISNIAGPLGFLVAGFLMDRVGITAVLFGVAALATLATGNVLLALRLLDAPPASPSDKHGSITTAPPQPRRSAAGKVAFSVHPMRVLTRRAPEGWSTDV